MGGQLGNLLGDKMRTPKHFTAKAFGQYILICALRDRETYLEAITPSCSSDLCEETAAMIAETKQEIKAIQFRILHS